MTHHETYAGIEITYVERTNRWVFVVDGKEYSSGGLLSAKRLVEALQTEKQRRPMP